MRTKEEIAETFSGTYSMRSLALLLLCAGCDLPGGSITRPRSNLVEMGPAFSPGPSVTLSWTNDPVDSFWHTDTQPENSYARGLYWTTGVAASNDLLTWQEIWSGPYTNFVIISVPAISQYQFYRAFNRKTPSAP